MNFVDAVRSQTMNMPNSGGKSRIAALDGLRATSILLVVACHYLPLGPKALDLNATAGAMGMSLFFSLSGFLIAEGLLRGQAVRDFFIRRFTRILPLALLYLVIVFFFNPIKLIGNALFLENYFDAFMGEYNAHFWSLCVEMHFYISIGMIVLMMGQRGIWLVIPLCLLVTGLRVYDGAVIDIRTHLRVDEILIGSCVALLHFHNRLRLEVSPVLVLAMASLWLAASWPDSAQLQYLRPYMTGSVLASTLMLRPSLLLTLLTSKAAKYIAAISYALYVIHPITISGWMNEGSTMTRYLFKRPISLLAAFGLAHLSTFYYEKRWIEFGRRLAKRPSVKEPQTMPWYSGIYMEHTPSWQELLLPSDKSSQRWP